MAHACPEELSTNICRHLTAQRLPVSPAHTWIAFVFRERLMEGASLQVGGRRQTKRQGRSEGADGRKNKFLAKIESIGSFRAKTG